MSLKIICAFPGTGKSHLVANPPITKSNAKFHDSDSSAFSWIYDADPETGIVSKERDPAFPENYIEHLLSLDDGNSNVVLASSHKAVRDALAEAGIPFYVAYPAADAREEYLERYLQRGSETAFIALLEKNWDAWIEEMKNESRAERRYELRGGTFLSDLF